MSVKKITEIGIIGAIYAALTIVLAPISFGVVQCRVSDSMIFLSKKNKNFAYGCAIGCVFANIASPIGLIDILIGAATNLAIGLIIHKVRHHLCGIITGSIICGITVGTELSIVYNAPMLISVVSVTVGEIISLIMGYLVYKLLSNKDIKRAIGGD